MKVGDQITSHMLEKSDATYKFDKLIKSRNKHEAIFCLINYICLIKNYLMTLKIH